LVSVADVSREGVAEVVADMRSVGVKNVVMLNGDNSADLRPYRLRGEASRI
jgi:cation transport ATPase